MLRILPLIAITFLLSDTTDARVRVYYKDAALASKVPVTLLRFGRLPSN